MADLPEELRARARAEALERYRRGERARPWHRLAGPAAFLASWLLRLGLLEGGDGLHRARLDAALARQRAAWLRELDRQIGGARWRGPLAERLRNAGRSLVVFLATLLFPKPRGPMPALADIRRILVIRTDERVGNQILTTPLLRALKLGIPHAELHVLANARKASVIVSRHVDRVIPFEKRDAFRMPVRLARLFRDLRRTRYDVVVDAGHWSGVSLTALLVARLAGGRAIVGHDRQGSDRFLSHPVTHDPANEVEVPAKLELLRPLGLLPRGLEPETELGSDTGPARELLSRLSLEPGVALLNPGARVADRRWSPAAHAAVARGLAARGLRVLVVWGPGEDGIARAVAEGSGAKLAPPTDLALLAGLLRLSRICVSNNSGPMHLAVAVGTPAVGVFLSGDAARWRHLLPIFQAAEPRGEDDAAAVLDACDRLLARTAARAVPHPSP